MKFTTAFLAALVGAASARNCRNITVPVQISARNAVFNAPRPDTAIDAINFGLNLVRNGHNYTNETLTGVS
jgi:hypothetical protein